MPSGQGVDKPRRENDSGRMVPRERWTPTTAITGPMGAVTAQVGPNDRGTAMAAWAGPQGHHAEVTSDVYSGGQGPYSGMEHNRYVAGPFRTPLRAQVAAESLANRVESGAGYDQYQNDSWTEHRGRR